MPVTTPEVPTVAIPVLLELHVPPVVASVRFVEYPSHTPVTPVIGACPYTWSDKINANNMVIKCFMFFECCASFYHF